MKRILVALDASDHAAPVLAYANQLAALTGAKLVLFRAVGLPIDLPERAFATGPAELVPLLLDQARTGLTRLAAAIPPERIESIETDLGTAWQAVCTAAARLDADLVVIGSHGYSTLDRLLGTTAARIVNHARCPVLVARDPAAHPL